MADVIEKPRPRRHMVRSDAIPEDVIVAALRAGKTGKGSEIIVPVGDTDIIVAVTRIAKAAYRVMPETSTVTDLDDVVFVHLVGATPDAITLPWNTVD